MGRGERSIKSLIPYQSGHSGQLSTSGETRNKKVPVAAAGSGPLAGTPLSTPSGQDVSCSEEESHQSRHLWQEGRPLPGPETGLLSNTRK